MSGQLVVISFLLGSIVASCFMSAVAVRRMVKLLENIDKKLKNEVKNGKDNDV